MSINSSTRGRRRRMLNEEFMSASQDTHQTYVNPSVEGSRYTEAANIENHPQITDFIPRRLRAYVTFLSASLILIAGLAFLHQSALSIALAIGSGPIPALDLTSQGSLGGWFSGLVLLATGFAGMLTYSLRRHRVSDYRARYRGWLYFSMGASILSLSVVTGLHRVCCDAMVHLTGWSALPNNAAWWLMPTVLVVSWVTFLIARDFAETKTSLVFFVLACASHTTALIMSFGWLTFGLESNALLASSVLSMVGHVCLLTATMAYARFIVLDVQGLIEHTTIAVSESNSSRSMESSNDQNVDEAEYFSDDEYEEYEEVQEEPVSNHRKAKKSKKQAQESHWVDGSEPEMDEDYNDYSGNRKPSKSELKRLRKQKAESRRAA